MPPIIPNAFWKPAFRFCYPLPVTGTAYPIPLGLLPTPPAKSSPNPRQILAEILAEYIIEHHDTGLIERVCHTSSNITSVYTTFAEDPTHPFERIDFLFE